MSYADLLARREAVAPPQGREIARGDLHWSLHEFQADVIIWAARTGRPAVWADTGLGKTRMQVEWCRVMGDTSLIVTTLAVAEQTVAEAAEIDSNARYVRSADELDGPGIYVTNYEMVRHFDPAAFDAVALDEASILKQSDGKTRTMLIEHFAGVQYRSTWTATPGPNDEEELTNQAEFLGQMTRTNMLAAYFVHDSDGWRMKGHAFEPMLRWMASWAIALRRPSDLGYGDDGYDLPGLDLVDEIVQVEIEPEPNALFALVPTGGVKGRAKVRRETLDARVDRTVSLVRAEPDEQWILWCGLNDEADALAAALPGAVNVHGSMSAEQKAEHLLAFARGELQVLITKPSIAGMGLNFQTCARMAFVGISDSYESYYQCIRRCYRYGQQRIVRAHIVLSEVEEQIARNVAAKERQANRVIDGLIAHIQRRTA